MWLTSSSVGRKFIMSITGICLVLFVTFHCLMNSVAIIWPAAYNMICEFLGANWYALIASMGLAVLFIIHICYAVCLTVQNRRARGNNRYAVSHRPKTVEWSSQNMFVLGIVILAFLVVHLINFWAKMQLVEVLGREGSLPPAAGTLFIQEAFSCIWVPIVYIIGFIALWFHMTHGFWSMFQSIGWDSTAWINRWKKIGCWWTTIVVALFVIQAIVFTINAHEKKYITDENLRNQYAEMAADELTDIFGEGIKGQLDYNSMNQMMQRVAGQPQMALMSIQMQTGIEPSVAAKKFVSVGKLVNYLNGDENQIDLTALEQIADNKTPDAIPANPFMMQGAPQQEQQPSDGQQEADNTPAVEETIK